jgi:hypothetical protein
MKDKFKIKLGDLVVHDEDFFIGKMGAWYLQTKKGVQMDIVPIGQVSLVQEPIQIGAQVLARVFVLFLKFVDLGLNFCIMLHQCLATHSLLF